MATISSAQEWADALDAHQKETGQSAGEIVSAGYADGDILGVVLDPNHPAADDQRAVIASESGWVVRYVPQSRWWEVVETAATQIDGGLDNLFRRLGPPA